jgi:hypothetical protein
MGSPRGWIAAALAGPLLAVPVAAGEIQFNGLVDDACVITIDEGGTLVSVEDGRRLSSAAPGGVAGRATLTVTGGMFGVHVGAPTAFKEDPDSVDDELVTRSFTLSGATTASPSIQTFEVNLNAGINQLTVNLSAVRTSGELFPAGNYVTETIVLCSQ